MAAQRGRPWTRVLSLTVLILAFVATVSASTGDKLPEFQNCLKVSFSSTLPSWPPETDGVGVGLQI